MNNQNKIICPNCQNPVDVNDVLVKDMENRFRDKYNKLFIEDKEKLQKEMEGIKKLQEDLKKQAEEQQAKLDEEVKKKFNAEKELLEKSLKEKLEKEQASRIEVIEKELSEKSEQLKELNRTKAEIEKLKREKDEMRDALEAEIAKKLNEKLSEEKEKIRKAEADRVELTVKELQKQLEDQKKLTEEMKRKQEQGSMQLQGEVQELGIEEWLRAQFPLDEITEIKKGERGADCMQIVHTRLRQHCGTIYYESKRTKEFKPAWLEKFREDIREKGAGIGVLVTDVYPKGMNRLGLIDGIWVCSFDEFKGLCLVLRENIIQLSNIVSSQENKGEKMTMLYDYLTGAEFRMQVEAIVEGFTQMQVDLTAEKRALMSQWKKREKQIQKVLLNTNHMYSSIKGIAGAAIQPIAQLDFPQLPAETEEDTE